MGRGNVCVHGKYEGLYYVDKMYIEHSGDESVGEWSMELAQQYYEEFVNELIKHIRNEFQSFERTYDLYGTILENGLFEIAIEDNEWSYAVKLLQKTADSSVEGLQARHSSQYLERMKRVLLEMFPEVGTYSGPWTHGVVKSNIGEES